MLTLYLESVNQLGEKRHFIFSAHELEQILDLATPLINDSKDVVAVTLLEEGKAIKLPLYIFDNQPFKAPIRQLQDEWLRLLKQPIQDKQAQQELLVKLIELRIDQSEQHIAFLESLLVRLELTYSQLRPGVGVRHIFVDTLNAYERLSNLYRHQLANAHSRRAEQLQHLK